MKTIKAISLISRLTVILMLYAFISTSCKKSEDTSTGDNTTTDPIVTDPGSSTNNMGLILNTTKAYQGYLLFAPKQYTSTYLINNDGRIMHQWSASKYPPGQSVYLLENGHILRTCMTKGQLSSGGGEGGRIEEYDWDDNLVWQLDFSTATYMQHHDIRRHPPPHPQQPPPPPEQHQTAAADAPLVMNESPVSGSSKQDRRMSDEWGSCSPRRMPLFSA